MNPEQFYQSQLAYHNRKLSVPTSRWRVGFNTSDGVVSYTNLSRDTIPLSRDEIVEWAHLEVKIVEGLESVISIEKII